MLAIDEAVEYDRHLDFYRRLGVLTGDEEKDAYWHRQAEYLHALSVCDAIRDAHIDATALSYTVKNAEADFHLRFGVARRTKFIWLSLRSIVGLIPPEREEPLKVDQVEEAARDLNVIYINIRGALDNLAWFLLEMFGQERTRKLSPIKISLFGKEFQKDKNLDDVAHFMATFVQWSTELRGRRDPAAHRIPLSVPPAIIDEETREEFERASAAYSAAFNDAIQSAGRGIDSTQKFENADARFAELEVIGKFVPVFVHHPAEGPIKIYPTVPQDVGQLVKIVRGLFTLARAKMANLP